MKHALTFLVIFVTAVSSLTAANDNYPFGGRASGMGNAAVPLYGFWAISHNQAGLARLETMSAGVYFENRFLARELNFGAGALAYPSTYGVLGFNFTHFGFDLYNETKVSLSYARSFGERFSSGLQLNYHNTYIADDYGNTASFTFELGFIFEILPGLHIGAHIFNPTRTPIGDFADERIPTIFRTGFSYEFSDRVILVAETEKSINHNPAFRAGVEYQITESLFLRGGIGTQPTTNAFGFGMKMGNLTIDMAMSFHHILGYSPQLSLMYKFR